MNDNYLNLTLFSFLDAITDKEIIYECEIKNDSFIGTLAEFKNALKNIDNKEFVNNLLRNKDKYTYKHELAQIEVYNYLEKITSKFDIEKTKLALNDIEVYYNMEFLERINQESEKEYKKNGWKIPTIKIKSSFIKNLYLSVEKQTGGHIPTTQPDHETMREKTHPFDSFNIIYALNVLKNKLINNVVKTETNPHPRIFKNDIAFKLFEYLKETVKNELADYSFIFRAMQKDKFIYESIKDSEFRNFLSKEYEIELDKLKLYDYCKTKSKENNYKTSKHLYKL